MTPERWKQVSRLYEAARGLSSTERAAFLADACAHDATLLREVQTLLDHPTSPPQLEGLTPAVVTQALGDAPDSILTGRRFGDYLVGDRIDSGGMGDVYRARDTRLERDVAIKVLQPVFAADPDELARFEREARLLAALDHPHIGTIYGVVENEGTRALVLALVEGETLAERLARGALPIGEALEYAGQIADALDAAHQKGIVHRDLKPGNIKLTPAAIVKVLDFGLAKTMGPAAAFAEMATAPKEAGHGAPDLAHWRSATAADTRDGVILGTAAYMSPEQARGLAVDKRTDIWAFGCVLYEMLTGRVAFAGQTISDTISAILEREVEWDRLPPATPASVRRLLHRCLVKQPTHRLRDIGGARLELDAAGEPDSAVSPHRRSSGARRVGRIAAPLAVMAIVLGAATWMRSLSTDGPAYRTDMLMPAGFESGSPPGRFAISPDGRRLAFTARNEAGKLLLWVRALDESTARPLAVTDGAEHPFWSPNNQMIAFYADHKLKKIAASGGAIFTICDAGTFAQGGTWNRDDVILFTFGQGPLFRVSANGGVPEQVTNLDHAAKESGHAFPFFLPDGKHFLYTGYSIERTLADRGLFVGGVYADSLDSAGRTQVLDFISHAEYARGHLLFVRDGALLAQPLDVTRLMTTSEATVLAEQVDVLVRIAPIGAFSASQDGTLAFETPSSPNGTQLTWIDRQGRRVGILGSRGNYGNKVQLSPDGTQAVVGRAGSGSTIFNLVLLDVPRNLERRLTSAQALEASPVWSPDGQRVAFARRSQGPFDLYVTSTAGERSEELLLTDDVSEYPESWSPNGRFLLYQRFKDSQTREQDIWVLPMVGEHKPFPFLATPFIEWDAQFSPDGRWVAYTSYESGHYEVYVSPFSDTGTSPKAGTPTGKWLVSTGSAQAPRWRRDGKEIFYWSVDSKKVMAAPVRADGPRLEVGRAEPLFDARPPLESYPFTFYVSGRPTISREQR